MSITEISKDVQDKAMELFKSGKPFDEIGKALGISSIRARQIIHKLDLGARMDSTNPIYIMVNEKYKALKPESVLSELKSAGINTSQDVEQAYQRCKRNIDEIRKMGKVWFYVRDLWHILNDQSK